MNSPSVGASDATQMATPNAMPVPTSTVAVACRRGWRRTSAPKSAPTPIAIVIQL